MDASERGRLLNKLADLMERDTEYLEELEAPRIPDPYYGGKKGFHRVIELLEDGCKNLLKQLQAP